MKLEFKDIINKEIGKSAVVIGMGPSLGAHQEKIKQLPPEKFTTISCNDVDALTSISPNYWVWANSEDNIKKTHERLNKKSSIIVYADSVDLTPREEVSQLLSVDYLPYDQRHFNSTGCGSPAQAGRLCCDHIIPGRLTIQEELQKYTNHNTHYKSSGTVAVQMLTLAVLLGCKNIYVTGVDLDYSKGYVGGQNAEQAKSFHANHESFTNNLPSILDTIKLIKDSATNIGTNIFCLDRGLPISSILEYSELCENDLSI